MTVNPEVIAEQVMGYVIGASEMIPTLKPSSQAYDIAILPQGPHFYTWLLQAAWYLLLDSQKRKMLMISQQADDLKDILVDSNNYGPVFGQSRKNSLTEVAVLAHQLGAKLARPDQGSLFESLRFQLPFLRIITDTDTLLHIGIGKDLSPAKMKRLISWIQHHIPDHNIVLLTNIESAKEHKKNDEQQRLSASLEKPSKNPLVNIFQRILASQKRKPEIIAYVNPGDFGMEWLSATRYVCAVG